MINPQSQREECNETVPNFVRAVDDPDDGHDGSIATEISRSAGTRAAFARRVAPGRGRGAGGKRAAGAARGSVEYDRGFCRMVDQNGVVHAHGPHRRSKNEGREGIREPPPDPDNGYRAAYERGGTTPKAPGSRLGRPQRDPDPDR